jgi:hypothetical protein
MLSLCEAQDSIPAPKKKLKNKKEKGLKLKTKGKSDGSVDNFTVNSQYRNECRSLCSHFLHGGQEMFLSLSHFSPFLSCYAKFLS